MGYLWVLRLVVLRQGDPLDSPKWVKAAERGAGVPHVCQEQLPAVHERHAGRGAAVVRVAASQLRLAQRGMCLWCHLSPSVTLNNSSVL